MSPRPGGGSRANGTSTAWTTYDGPRGGFLPDEALSFTEMPAQADSSMFKTIIINPNHVLRSLCTLRPTIQYRLRPRSHPFNLPVNDNKNFLSRLMFLGTY